MKQRIYIDTSVVGGYFDKEFAYETQALFKRLENKEIIFVISELLFNELENAPLHIQQLLDSYDDDCLERISMSNEAKDLADKYVAENVVGQTA